MLSLAYIIRQEIMSRETMCIFYKYAFIIIYMQIGTSFIDTSAKCLCKRFFPAMPLYYNVIAVNSLTWSHPSLEYPLIVNSTVIYIPSISLTNLSSNFLQDWSSEPIHILLVTKWDLQWEVQCLYLKINQCNTSKGQKPHVISIDA